MCRTGIVIFFSLLGLPLWSQVDVKAELDSARIMIGDQVSLTLRIAHSQDVKISRIDWSELEKQEKIEVLYTGNLDTIPSGDQTLLQQKLRLTSFDSGFHRIPPVAVHFIGREGRGTASTNELSLLVTTFPIQSDTASLAPIKPIIEEPLVFQDVLPYVLGLVLAIILIGGIWLLLSRRKEVTKIAVPEVVRPAHEIALGKLRELRAAKLWQQGRIKDFHSDLTYIVREYLENRYHIPALESTTDEIVEDLRSVDPENGWREKLLIMFRTADLVKFAKAMPPVTVHAEMLDHAEQFVEATREKEKPEEEETEEEKTEELNKK